MEKILNIIYESSKNNYRNYVFYDEYEKIYLFFDLNDKGHEVNFNDDEIKTLKQLNFEIAYARPMLEIDLGFKRKEDFDLKIAKRKVRKGKCLSEWQSKISEI